METLLHAAGIAIEIDGRELVSNVAVDIGRGRTLGIVGETGSGKSLTCRAFAGLLDTVGGRISRGALTVAGRDFTAAAARHRSGMYGRVLSLIPQNSLSALNPLMRVGSHLTETIKLLDAADGMSPEDRAAELLGRLGLREPERVLRMYPHQLSGGMRQRVMIALAVAGRPQLLIADEPTTALDVSVQREILDVLRRLTEEEEMALVLVSHDLDVVSAVTESVAVMYAGMIVEQGPTETVLRHPRHPYTRALLQARPRIGRTGRLVGIPGTPATPDSWPSGCRFTPRCAHAQDKCSAALPALETIGPGHSAACSRVHELSAPDRSQGRRAERMSTSSAGDGDPAGRSAQAEPDLAENQDTATDERAAPSDRALVAADVTFSYGSGPAVVRNVSLTVPAGGVVGVVGESGSGKSTLAGLLVGMLTPSAGTVTIHGRAWGAIGRRDPMRRAVQMVFQNPYTALNPRLSALRTVAEVYRVCGGASKAVAHDRAREMLARVGITGLAVGRRSGELSGGQCQRVGIARALAADPAIIVADEPASALDVSIQAQILNLLSDLRQQQGVGLVLISHDLNVVSYLTEQAIVMNKGVVVEQGPTTQLLESPAHPYTQSLIRSIL